MRLREARPPIVSSLARGLTPHACMRYACVHAGAMGASTPNPAQAQNGAIGTNSSGSTRRPRRRRQPTDGTKRQSAHQRWIRVRASLPRPRALWILFSSLKLCACSYLVFPFAAGQQAPPEGDVEEHEHEYTHSYYPLETKELNINEQNFIWKAQEGALDACTQLLAQELVDVDVQDQWGSTALMHAVNKKHTSLVHFLLSKKANIDKQDYVSHSDAIGDARLHWSDRASRNSTFSAPLPHVLSRSAVSRV
jgi:hypothetical protein